MNSIRAGWKRFAAVLGVLVGLMGLAGSALAQTYDTNAFSLATAPLFLTQRALPLVMLDMSRDHQLYFKAYDDYSDIDQDGTIDTTYKDSIDYYGYFDSQKCYAYNDTNKRFEPKALIAATATDHYCNASGATTLYWSGNFLNWATMTRIDTVRKILYGGYRSTDTAADTVLERSYLPNDAHSFAKYYNGNDLTKLTPITGVTTGNATSSSSGITICNTTVNGTSAMSQNVTDPPLMRLAKGNFALWAANERWQCRWNGEVNASNGNDSTKSGLYAKSSNPVISTNNDGLKVSSAGPDFVVRVQVCVSAALIGSEKCKSYPNGTGNSKPIGLLQDYGDSNEIMFGLMTGSYAKNKSGGVLRRQISKISNETNVTTDGTFVTTDLAEGNIIRTLDKLRIYGYSHKMGSGDDCGTYFSATGSDSCSWGLSSFSDGSCTNWGNPQSEIYLEALRYFAGKTKTAAFSPGSSEVLGLKNQASWTAPVTDNNYCAALNIIQFNASTSSYDSDQLTGASDLGMTLSTETDNVGNVEGITNNDYFVGETPTDTNQLCTAKRIANFSTAKGTCPDAPRLGGSYQIAGLASYARNNDMVSTVQDKQTIKTFGVALAPASPRITIAVPGSSTGQKVTLQPACRNAAIGGNCAIVDFKIVSQSVTATQATGSLYVNWEDSEQGGDFDQDMWGMINYTVTGSTVTVTTNVVAKSTGDKMGFGYVISGTTTNGFYAHSGINDFTYAAPTGQPSGVTIKGCTNCNAGDTASVSTFKVGASSAKALEQPLYYASKWGGFNDSDSSKTPNLTSEWDVDGDGIPDTYFYSTNPAELASALDSAFAKVSKQIGSGSAVSANSTRLDTGTVVYQAKFDSTNWSGQLQAYSLNADAGLNVMKWDASASGWTLNSSNKMDQTIAAARKIYTCCDPNVTTIAGRAKPLSGLIAWQLAALQTSGEGNTVNASQRLGWLRGDQANEQPTGKLRARDFDVVGNRSTLLGDIINSDPVFSGSQSFHYELLAPLNPDGTTNTGASTYADYITTKKSRTPVVFISANDGMLHAFNADTGKELFAYIPSQALKKAAALTAPNYGTPANPHQYFVDGLSFVGDVFDGTNWKTVLVGSLGGGGKGIFALDVTNPTTFTDSNVLFEVTDATDSRMGYMLGQPLVARMSDGRWAAIFGNGYNSTAGKASLFIVDIFKRNNSNTTLDIKVIDTDAQTNNGLSGPALLVDGTNTVTAAYAGDLQGRLWKFDLSSTSAASWGVAYTSGNNPAPLYTAAETSGNGNIQPITATPVLGLNSQKNNAVMVYFGTGRYVGANDGILPNTVPVQTFYGIADSGAAIPFNRSTHSGLTAKTISTTNQSRTVTDTVVNWSNSNGWYLDLSASSGERVISKAILAYDRVIFSTLIPSQGQCNFGGSSWLMDIGGVGAGTPILSSPAKFFNAAIVKTPIMQTTSSAIYISFNDVTGGYHTEKGRPPPGSGRMSWRQLQ